MNPDDFWHYLERLVVGIHVIIDRPKASRRPHNPDIGYSLDNGYLDGTTSGDGSGIDIRASASVTHGLSVVIMSVDLQKRDPERKIPLSCTEDEIQTILVIHNEKDMRATLVCKPKE